MCHRAVKHQHNQPAKNQKFSIFLGIIMPVFNDATRREMFSISLPFLNSSEIFLIMIFFYNLLCAVFRFLGHHAARVTMSKAELRSDEKSNDHDDCWYSVFSSSGAEKEKKKKKKSRHKCVVATPVLFDQCVSVFFCFFFFVNYKIVLSAGRRCYYDGAIRYHVNYFDLHMYARVKKYNLNV